MRRNQLRSYRSPRITPVDPAVLLIRASRALCVYRAVTLNQPLPVCREQRTSVAKAPVIRLDPTAAVPATSNSAFSA
jgi:hypothetical protein